MKKINIALVALLVAVNAFALMGCNTDKDVAGRGKIIDQVKESKNQGGGEDELVIEGSTSADSEQVEMNDTESQARPVSWTTVTMSASSEIPYACQITCERENGTKVTAMAPYHCDDMSQQQIEDACKEVEPYKD